MAIIENFIVQLVSTASSVALLAPFPKAAHAADGRPAG
jgi:hypothetical protein